MYFIMRSSLMNRIREIGIYRAIGVSKRNILLRFGVEASLVSAGTVLVGYLVSGIFIRLLEHISPNAETIFYYPTWYALLVMVVLLGETILCGILPVISLLRKTPSEILAKYDV
jgi:ABC-type antimicrobial peptide transport system permease subunit